MGMSYSVGNMGSDGSLSQAHVMCINKIASGCTMNR